MINSEKNLFNPFFSHIYVEENALKYKNTKDILSKFPNSNIIKINHYKDVFCRSNQYYLLQKQSPKLIIAEKKGNLVYKGARVCNDFGNENFYYTSCMMNCIYNCEYCYLQGMYPSANIVIFVNIDDIFNEVSKILEKLSAYFCISYDTDLLAFENIIGYVRKWINFAKNNMNLKIEIRTKSANFKSIEDIEPQSNVILAWTLSPNEIIEKFEHNTPYLNKRIDNINKALNKNWKVRLCFEPIIYIDNWKEIYNKFIEYVFSSIDYEYINDISIGTFRIGNDYLKIMRKQQPTSSILNYPFESRNGVFQYENEISNDMIYNINCIIKKYVSEDKIYIWSENS